jgi:hypothetical protein
VIDFGTSMKIVADEKLLRRIGTVFNIYLLKALLHGT